MIISYPVVDWNHVTSDEKIIYMMYAPHKKTYHTPIEYTIQ